MTAHDTDTTRRGDRLLAALLDAEARWEAPDRDVLCLVGTGSLRRMRIERPLVAALLAADLLVETADPAGPERSRLTLSAAGRARVRRTAAGDDGFRMQHGAPVRRTGDGEAGFVDEAESPLAWLARRRDRNGRAFLSPARVAAGERLRADFTLAQMMPQVTSNWSVGVRTGGAGPGGLGDLTDRSLAARDRVRAALGAVDAELADLLVDVCCFLKGLEVVESDRGWPARSAKVVLDIALGRLARHYGFADEARGPEASRRVRMWGAEGYRPAIAPRGEAAGGAT